MKDLAILLRCMQLYTHNCHNLIQGSTFFEDHSFLGDLYKTYEELYDSVVERLIGSYNMQPNELLDIQIKAAELLKDIQQVCAKIEGSLGTLNMIAQIADDSEIRIYKLQQKTK